MKADGIHSSRRVLVAVSTRPSWIATWVLGAGGRARDTLIQYTWLWIEFYTRPFSGYVKTIEQEGYMPPKLILYHVDLGLFLRPVMLCIEHELKTSSRMEQCSHETASDKAR